MNRTAPDRCRRGFTLLELLVVMAIIAILVSLLFSVITRAAIRARQAWCSSNLRQIGVGLTLFSDAHGGRYPWQLSVSEGGSAEYNLQGMIHGGTFLRSTAAFLVASNDLSSPRIVSCPGTRSPWAPSWNQLRPANLNYAVHLRAEPGHAESVLAVDDNLSAPAVPAGQSRRATNELMSWTAERHADRGTALYADTHVAVTRNVRVLPPPTGVLPGRPGRPIGGGFTPAPTPRFASSGGSGSSPGGPSGGSLGRGTTGSVQGGNEPGSPVTAAVSPKASPVPTAPAQAKANKPSVPPPAAEPASAHPDPVFTPEEEEFRRNFLWIWLLVLLLGTASVAYQVRKMRRKAAMDSSAGSGSDGLAAPGGLS